MTSLLPAFGSQNASTLVVYAVAGIAAGVGVNRLNKYLDAKLPGAYRNKFAASALKMLPIVAVLLVAQMLAAPFARNWQGTTPGLFFVTFFFGLQTSLMEDLTSLA